MVGPTSFVRSEQTNYINYAVIAQAYPGWSLDEIRNLNVRQRTWWLALIEWKKDQARV